MNYSTGYIIRFAMTVCVVCSIFVAGSAVLLKDRQEANKVLDRYQKVLTVAGLMEEGQDLSRTEIRELFAKSISTKAINLKTGEYIADFDTENYDQRRASKDPALSSKAPSNAAKVLRVPNNALVYLVEKGGQVEQIVLPIEGKGLWSTLYGFISLKNDGQTIQGITFYEHGETPGLGGEVDNPKWKSLWKDRQAFGEQGEVKIEVIKGAAGSPQDSPYEVDGLSGATITSRGVTYMLQFWLGEDGFGPFLQRFRQGGQK